MATDTRSEIAHVQDWLDGERLYAESKWAPGFVDENIDPARYREWVEQHLHRAIVLGVENPLGRTPSSRQGVTDVPGDDREHRAPLRAAPAGRCPGSWADGLAP